MAPWLERVGKEEVVTGAASGREAKSAEPITGQEAANAVEGAEQNCDGRECGLSVEGDFR